MPLGNSIKGIIQIPTVYDLTGISGEVNDVCIVGNNCVITTDENGAVIPLDFLEVNIVREAIYILMPDHFRLEITQHKNPSHELQSKCSIVGVRKHMMIAYAYGDSTLSASMQCLIEMHEIKLRGGYGIEKIQKDNY